MRKKLWIRFVGLAALLLWAFDGLLFRAGMLTADLGVKTNNAIEGFLTFALACFLTGVWALFSVIDWALRRQAKLRAAEAQLQAAAELLSRAGGSGGARAPQPGASSAESAQPVKSRGRGVMTSPLGLS